MRFAVKEKCMTNEQVNPNCRLCGNSKETIQHIIAACPNLSASMYLPLRRNSRFEALSPETNTWAIWKVEPKKITF